MSEPKTSDAPTAPVPVEAPAPLALTPQHSFTLAPRTLTEAMDFAKLMADSGLVPDAFRNKPADVLVAVQMGMEVGVSPVQALQNIAVINGRPCMWGDLIVALVQASGELEHLTESWDEGSQTATVRIKRKGKPEHIETFSMADAQKAGLAGKQTYKQFPKRMCTWRAKSWAIRAEFADTLKGLSFRDEMEDRGDPIDVTPRPVAMPRRSSEAIDDFLNARPGAEGQATAPPRQPAAKPEVWTGVINTVDTKQGTTKGKDWLLYVITGADGAEFGTFSESHANVAYEAAESGEELAIEWTPTTKGGKHIQAIGPSAHADQREPGQDG